jgi:sulfate transport system ATP-binding protein
MSITLRDITKRFGSFVAVDGVSVEVPTGELVALIGPSGSGKTTLLRIIAGLEIPDAGTILFDDEDATRQDVGARRVGFVFQHYALFRHMTVFENIAFGLRVRPRRLRLAEREIRDRVEELLRLVQLDWLADRYPSQLSGGQRQRVALARALAIEPRVLLLDEPFGALDAKVRKELRRWLRRFHDELKITSVFVTHDQDEALEVADRVVVMNAGRVEQVGAPEAVYEAPATPFVYNFLGSVNLFHGRVDRGRVTIAGLEVEAPDHGEVRDTPAVAYVRPHDIEVVTGDGGAPLIGVIVRHVLCAGAVVRLDLERTDSGGLIEAELSKERYRALGLGVGDRAAVRLRALRVFVDQPVPARSG